jgi:uncharacterized protein
MQPAMAYRDADSVNSAMYRVFVYMGLALLVTASVSGVVASSPALMSLFFATWLKWPVIFAPLVAVLALNWYISQGPSLEGARAALLGFAALMGVSIATVFHNFALGSVFFAFLSAVILFAVLAGWGYFTRRDLSGWGSILMAAVIALIIVAVLNIFLANSMLSLAVSAIAIVVFSALTAYDSQRIREQIQVDTNTDMAEVLGALSLYLNLVNIFLALLNLTGDRE